MEAFVFLAVLGGVAFLLRMESNKQSALMLAQQNATLSTTGQGKGSGSGSVVPALFGGLATVGGTLTGGSAGQITAVAGAAVTGYGLGSALNKWLMGADADEVNTAAGGLAGAIIVGVGAAFALGWVSGPFYAVVVAAAVLVYAVVAIVDDQEKLSYGQAGAVADYLKHWSDVYAKCYANLRVTCDASVPDSAIERKLTAFIDGYMSRLNYLAYLQYMHAPKGFTGLGLDTQGKAEHGSIRGYFVGGVEELDDRGSLIFNGEKYNQSQHPLWVRRVLPFREIEWEQRTTMKGTAAVAGSGASISNVNAGESKEYVP